MVSNDGQFGSINISDALLENSQAAAGHHFAKDKVAIAVKEIRGNIKGQDIGDSYYKGVGVRPESGWSLEQKLQEAGLNWATESSGVRYGNRLQYSAPQSRAIYRSDNGELFGVVNDSWKPYQNTEVVNAFDEFCRDSGLEMERLGSLRGGRVVFASAIADESWEIMGSEDVIAARILLQNSHEYGVGLTVKLNAVRLACCNGLTQRVSVGQQTLGHNVAFNKATVAAILQNSRTNFRNLGETLDSLAGVNLSQSEARNLLVETLGDRDENGLVSFVNQNRLVRAAYNQYINNSYIGASEVTHGNAWGLLNCVTEELNHHSRSYGEKHINSLWNGGKAQTGSKILTAMEHALLNRGQKNTQSQGVRAF